MYKIKVIILLLICCNLVLSQSELSSEREPKKGTIITGSCLFAHWYATCLIVGGIEGDMSIAIPFVGPYILDHRQGSSTPGTIMATAICLTELASISMIIRGIIGKPKTTNISVGTIHSKHGNGLKICLYF